MRIVSRRASVLFGFVAALSLVVAGAGAARDGGGIVGMYGEPGRDFVAGEILVKLEDSAANSDLERINERNDAETEELFPEADVSVVDLPPGLTVEEAVEAYENSPDVEYAEPDYLLRPAKTPNDPRFTSLYGLNNTGQNGGTRDADIDAPEAWNITTGSDETVVAVIDEGVDINHPDLRENIWTNEDEIPDNGLDDDGNGFVDDVNGWDFRNDDASVYDSASLDAHGTHVAGTIAARGDNDIGVVGVSWRARIMPLKFLGAETGSTSDAAEAIDYAVANGATISNNSWGGGGNSRTLRDAISRAESSGHLFVAAAGNGGSDGGGDDNDRIPTYPASYDLPNIISVAATTNRDALATYSNYGDVSVDLAAPGSGILSTLPDNSYGSFSGTSMATPHVAGVAALLESEEPGLGYAALKARIFDSVDAKSSLSGKVATGGRLNAANAVASGAVGNEDPVGDQPIIGDEPDESVAPDTTAPTITPLRPKPASRMKTRSARIVATVRDDRAKLARNDIRVFVDGRARGRTYDSRTGRLTAASGRLAYGAHTVKIVATDDAGNTKTRAWRFRVVR